MDTLKDDIALIVGEMAGPDEEPPTPEFKEAVLRTAQTLLMDFHRAVNAIVVLATPPGIDDAEAYAAFIRQRSDEIAKVADLTGGKATAAPETIPNHEEDDGSAMGHIVTDAATGRVVHRDTLRAAIIEFREMFGTPAAKVVIKDSGHDSLQDLLACPQDWIRALAKVDSERVRLGTIAGDAGDG